MKWRCEWCDKPHEENDPPCDSCSHGSFERAVVPEYETVETGTSYVWACSNCGREHVKNSPPCSRCGEPELERAEPSYENVERDLDVPGYLAFAKPYAPVFVVLAIVVGLFATGVVPLSILPGIGPPSPPDAPGESTEAGGLDFATVEGAVHDRLEEERRAAGDSPRSSDDGLADYAEYENRRYVIATYADADPPDAPDWTEFGTGCDRRPSFAPPEFFDGTIAEYDDEGTLATDIANALLESRFSANVRTGFGAEGIDLHADPDGAIYAFYATC